MTLCWVSAGECGKETSIEARKVGPVKMVFEITTTCEHIQALASELVVRSVRFQRQLSAQVH
jgi:hypothetical protein